MIECFFRPQQGSSPHFFLDDKVVQNRKKRQNEKRMKLLCSLVLRWAECTDFGWGGCFSVLTNVTDEPWMGTVHQLL